MQITYSSINGRAGQQGQVPRCCAPCRARTTMWRLWRRCCCTSRWNWIVVLASGDDSRPASGHLLSQRLSAPRHLHRLPGDAAHAAARPDHDAAGPGASGGHRGKLQPEHAARGGGVLAGAGPAQLLPRGAAPRTSRAPCGSPRSPGPSTRCCTTSPSCSVPAPSGITTQARAHPGLRRFRVRRSRLGRPALSLGRGGATCNRSTCLNTHRVLQQHPHALHGGAWFTAVLLRLRRGTRAARFLGCNPELPPRMWSTLGR